MKKKLYSFAVQMKVDAELPQRVKDALSTCGWNAFGIYELVATELRKEKAQTKRQQK
jgi:hypothetical protein